MNIFVSEYLCSGAWADEVLPKSLVTEGFSMLQSLCEDLLLNGEYQVSITQDQRIAPLMGQKSTALAQLQGIKIVPVNSPAQEWELFQQLAKQADSTILIAPELEGILSHRITWLEQNGLNRLMSHSKQTDLCADKLLFYEFCLKHKIPTPKTFLLSQSARKQVEFPCEFPFIVKPQFGAGSTMTAVIENKKQWQEFESRRKTEDDFPPYILQPFLSAIPVSIACLIPDDQTAIDWFPIGLQQYIGLQYQGGTIPFEHALNSEISKIAKELVSYLPGLRGYIGIDFLLLPEPENRVQVLEINSRLTTSYLGYRALTKQSLGQRLIELSNKQPVQWSNQIVQFNTGGEVEGDNSN